MIIQVTRKIVFSPVEDGRSTPAWVPCLGRASTLWYVERQVMVVSACMVDHMDQPTGAGCIHPDG